MVSVNETCPLRLVSVALGSHEKRLLELSIEYRRLGAPVRTREKVSSKVSRGEDRNGGGKMARELEER